MVFVTVDFACVVITEQPGLGKELKEKLQSSLAETGLLCKPGLKTWITNELLLFQRSGFSAILTYKLKCCHDLPAVSSCSHSAAFMAISWDSR